MLPRGDPGDDLVGTDAFSPHTGDKSSSPTVSPRQGSLGRRRIVG
jgi:hypothetical protein